MPTGSCRIRSCSSPSVRQTRYSTVLSSGQSSDGPAVRETNKDRSRYDVVKVKPVQTQSQ